MSDETKQPYAGTPTLENTSNTEEKVILSDDRLTIMYQARWGVTSYLSLTQSDVVAVRYNKSYTGDARVVIDLRAQTPGACTTIVLAGRVAVLFWEAWRWALSLQSSVAYPADSAL